MPARDNFDESQFAQVIQLREAGVPIPGHWAVRYSSLLQKAELEQDVKAIEGLDGEPNPMEERMAEIQLQMLEGELEKLFADIGVTQSQAELNYAKAQDIGNDQVLQDKLVEADISKTQLEQATRLRVQRMKEMSSNLRETMKMQAARQKQKVNTKTPARP
jgi:hypothetical protein